MSAVTYRVSCILLIAMVLATIPACSGLARHERTSSPIADERLAALLTDYRSLDGGLVMMSREEVIVDSGRLRNDIERLTLEFPNHVPSLMASAQLAVEYDEPVKAMAFLNRVSDIDPLCADATVLRVRVALAEGSVPKARRLVSEQLDRSPDHAGLREVEASVHFLSGDYDQARKALSAASALGAPPERVLYHLALVEEKSGRLPEARRLYQESYAAGNERAGARLRGLDVPR